MAHNQAYSIASDVAARTPTKTGALPKLKQPVLTQLHASAQQAVQNMVAGNSTSVQDDALELPSACSPEVVKVLVGYCSPAQ